MPPSLADRLTTRIPPAPTRRHPRRVTVLTAEVTDTGRRRVATGMPTRGTGLPDPPPIGGLVDDPTTDDRARCGLAATGAMLRRRASRVPTDPFDPNAIRAETAAARTAELVAPAAGPTRRPGPDLCAGDRDRGRPPAPRPALLPADAGGHRGGDRPRPPAHLRLQGRRHRRDLPDRAGRPGRGRRGGPICRSTPSAARSTSAARTCSGGCSRRASRSWPRTGSPSSGPATWRTARSGHVARTCSTSTIARWPSSTAGSATSVAAASRTTTTTSASTTSCAGWRDRSSPSSSRSSC